MTYYYVKLFCSFAYIVIKFVESYDKFYLKGRSQKSKRPLFKTWALE